MEASKERIVKFLTVSVFFLTMVTLWPMFLGFGKGGFSIKQVFEQFNLYLPVGWGSLGGLILLFALDLFISSDDKYGNSIGFGSGGEKPALPLKIFKNEAGLYLLSLIAFGFLGLLSFTLSQQSFTGVGQLEQQFTAFDNILYSFTLIASSENLGAYFFFALGIFVLKFSARQTKMSTTNYRIFYYLLILLFTIYGLVNHNLRYSGSEIDLIRVAGFWTVGGVITALTGSGMPFLALHQANNIFFDLRGHFSSDIVVIGTIAIVAGLGVLYYLIFVKWGKHEVKT